MAFHDGNLHTDELHPIDVVEHLASVHAWDFDRVAEDQISMVVEGQWRSYSITLAWGAQDETLRLISTFEMEPPADRLPALYDVINRANDEVWTGAFTYWADQKLMVWRYVGALGHGVRRARADRPDDRCGCRGLRAVLPCVPADDLGRRDAGSCDQGRHCRGVRAGLVSPPPNQRGT